MASAWGKSWGLSWGGSWGAIATPQDTHDGFWRKQYLKMWGYKKPTKKEVQEAVEESPQEAIESVSEVKAKIRQEYGRIDYDKIAQNVEMQRFVAAQILIAIESRRAQLDEEDAEILLLM
jgi:hypothetical protein